MNAFAVEFVPTFDEPDGDDTKIEKKAQKTTYKKLQPFAPYHAARAKLNIYIPKHMTKTLLSTINEPFPNTNTLYYYLDISTALQINDGQMDVIQTQNGDKIVIINFDLHKKGTKETLYAIVTPNDEHKIEANTHKWMWKLDEFLTENEIFSKYEIISSDLPNSSRSMKGGIYQQFVEQKSKINEVNSNFVSLLKEYKWNSNEIKIIGSSQKSKKSKRKNHEIKVSLDSDLWINSCIQSWNNLPLIPIAVYENRDINKHWIEWVKLIYIEEQQSFVGLTFKYDDNEWQIESVCLDRGDIHNKHRLIGLQNIHLYNNGESMNINANYDQYFSAFNTTITEIQWS